MRAWPARPRPAGLLWLLAHEGRLLWRGSVLLRSRRYVVAPVLLVTIGFQAAAFWLAGAIIRHPLPAPELILAADLNLFFLFFLMLSRAMTAAIDVLYGRGEVDVLLAAPLPPGRVLAARMLGVAASVAAPWLLLGGALANALAAFGQPWGLALYPMLAALGLVAASLAFALVVALVAWLPPGRARQAGHLASLAVGLLIFGLGQAPRLLGPAATARLWRGLLPGPDLRGFSCLPGRAMLGAPAPLLACCVFSLLVFALVRIGLADRFAAGAIGAAAHRAGGAGGRPRFSATPWAAILLLYARLLIRFPGLATQIVYRALALVPVLLILAGHGRAGSGQLIVAPMLVFLGGQLALFFVSVLAATDQAPELAAAAPLPPTLPARVRMATAAAAVLLVLALPLAAVAWVMPRMLPVLLPALAAAMLANLQLGLRLPIPLRRADFGKSQAGSVFGLLLGLAASFLCALAAWLCLIRP